MDQAITDSLNCYRICVETLTYCIRKGGKHTEPEHLQILKDCAEICILNASFMIKGSAFHGQTAQLCADICGKCAASYEAIDPKDAQMVACAQMCRKCAKSCRDMVEDMEV